ncbi:MAG: GntR family transcriptional regulator [Lentisphaeria bacterium]|jgi:GntR family transcriptional regulator|nr:GntR family transcriptional regulator [Lentisphaeria bacterium]
MLFRYDARSGVPIFRQLEEQIQRGVLSGALAVGEKLPAVRDLAAELGVNPMTVSKAYSHLEMEGWVERQRGVGLFVRPRPAAAEDEERLRLLSESLRDAAFCAVQMGIPLAEALQLLERHYRALSKNEE